ncbi:MBL fold metallo-hydrolase [Marinithermofilum abyssi]|uniref:MBL fold metallo-hydrolase n=1 Tax=Marinithermofilum abyssi TaxID=1571185 RepID=A0A8J2VDA3_9BACL|nr:MBL fold metallo-hydrolase [Marinithermofilum abyssi]GGE07161.1 MBL fold metallo-hydrolase [Marinithermofilum abyssi]
MGEETIYSLGGEIYVIDGFDLKKPGRTGVYVMNQEPLTIVETGPSMSVPHILGGLKKLDRAPEEVEYVIVTHIHLDHAGGVGLFLQSCPRAKVVVHPRGARHLADPSRLIQGARMVYGEEFDALFDPVLPVPEDRILVKGEGDKLRITDDRVLTFWDTPGHAAHHISIHDSLTHGYFTGDTAGIRYVHTEEYGFSFYVPSTSPNQFDPDAMKHSIQRYRNEKPDRIYYGHFGMTEQVDEALDEVKAGIDVFMQEAQEALSRGEGESGIERRLVDRYVPMLEEKGLPEDSPAHELLRLDLQVSAMGLALYLNRQKK